FGPCKCPIVTFDLAGRFELKYAGFDGLYDNYEVSHVVWRATLGDRAFDVVGSGKYRVGGEVAITQQMTLDLSADGQPVQQFDSGLAPGGGGFPKIDIQVRLARPATVCLDTVIHVIAVPIQAGVGGGAYTLGLSRAQPNPFGERVQVQLG